jgi:hypothetical protein
LRIGSGWTYNLSAIEPMKVPKMRLEPKPAMNNNSRERNGIYFFIVFEKDEKKII